MSAASKTTASDSTSEESLDAHYTQFEVQPTEAAMRNKLDACQSHITKYLWRWRLKGNGMRDLYAARGLLDQYIHFEETGDWLTHGELEERRTPG